MAGITLSFLMDHVYYSAAISATRFSVLARARQSTESGSPCTRGLQCYNVTNILPLLSLQTPVTRKMRDGGEVLNPGERITAEPALRAVTIDAAWQCRFEKEKAG